MPSLKKVQADTYHPTLNSTWASKRATTGAVATLHPLTRDLISPSCLLCRTTLMKPGLRAFTSSTYFFSFSLSSSAQRKELDVNKKHQFANTWKSVPPAKKDSSHRGILHVDLTATNFQVVKSKKRQSNNKKATNRRTANYIEIKKFHV